MLIAIYTENKNKKLTYQIPDLLIQQLESALKDAKDWPLEKNTKDQEQQIIESFLTNKVIEVYRWETIAEWADRVEFKFNTDNFIVFMNDVAKINNVESNFDWDKEQFKNLVIKWYFDIKNKLIIDSRILTDFMLRWINSQTNQEQYQQLTLDTKLKILDPKILDFDVLSAISTADFPENKLIFRIKWLIK